MRAVLKRSTACVIIMLAVSVPAYAEPSPSLKLPTAWFIAGATFDYVVTNRGLRNGLREANPIWTFANDDPAAILVCSIVVDAATLWLSHRYAVHHPRLAKTLLYSVGGIRFSAGFHGIAGNLPAPTDR